MVFIRLLWMSPLNFQITIVEPKDSAEYSLRTTAAVTATRSAVSFSSLEVSNPSYSCSKRPDRKSGHTRSICIPLRRSRLLLIFLNACNITAVQCLKRLRLWMFFFGKTFFVRTDIQSEKGHCIDFKKSKNLC